MYHLVLPAAALVASKVVPAILFPAPDPKKELTVECQRLASRFVAVSVVVNLVVIAAWWVSRSALPATSFLSLLAAELRMEAVNAAFLAYCVLQVAMSRAQDPNGVLGQRTGVAPGTEIAIRICTNTTEQLLIGVLVRLGLAASLGGVAGGEALLSLLNGVWLSGRVLFAVGYHTPSNPMGRELGFDLTIMCNLMTVPLILFFGFF